MTSLLSLAWPRLRAAFAASKTARCVVSLLIVALPVSQASLAQTAQPPAPLKLIMLTADWCSKCQVLEPAISRALEQQPDGLIETVRIDLTKTNQGSDAKKGIYAASRARLTIHGTSWIWEEHGGRTGLAWLVSARSGEPLACFTSEVPPEQIAGQMSLAEHLVASSDQSPSTVNKTDCPGLIG